MPEARGRQWDIGILLPEASGGQCETQETGVDGPLAIDRGILIFTLMYTLLSLLLPLPQAITCFELITLGVLLCAGLYFLLCSVLPLFFIFFMPHFFFL